MKPFKRLTKPFFTQRSRSLRQRSRHPERSEGYSAGMTTGKYKGSSAPLQNDGAPGAGEGLG
jgi:hypothetical protein